MLVQSSNSYIWSVCASSTLGSGATGAVYRGQHLVQYNVKYKASATKSGKAVAVKTFPFERFEKGKVMKYLTREFEALKILNHENIVQMLAMEKELKTGWEVLIMELCTGQSLFTILNDPQNNYGLEEEEFLSVLKDVAAGMEYLRNKKIVHRDLKPGNIMKFIKEDGKSVYKLIDFGAARELEDDEIFQSLHGTEEYLHPDLYERAVLRRPASKDFKATVDLWSVGVTLYHVATGSLPFQPYGGRLSRETMYKITTEKASGVISGVQRVKNGDIKWSNVLPVTCLLNQELQKLLITLLAGILESQSQQMWGFEKFFKHVTDIVSRKSIHVFYLNEAKEITLFLKPDATLTDVKEQISIQVNVPPCNQLLLYNKTVFDTFVDTNMRVFNYPKTTCSQPLILLHKEKTEVNDFTRFGALAISFPSFNTNIVSFEHDVKVSRDFCSVAHAVKRLVERLVRCGNLSLKAPADLLFLVFENVTKLWSNLSLLDKDITTLNKRFTKLEKRYITVTECEIDWSNDQRQSELLNISTQVISEKKKLKEQINQRLESVQSSVSALRQEVLISGLLQQKWDQITVDMNDIQFDGCVEKANTYLNEMRCSWQLIMKSSKNQDFPYNDARFYALERTKILRMSRKLSALLESQCVASCHQVSKKLDEWYSGLQMTMTQCKSLEEEVDSLRALSESHAVVVEKMETNVDNLVQKIIKTPRHLKSPNQSLSSEKQSSIVDGNGLDRPHCGNSPQTSISSMWLMIDGLKVETLDMGQLVEEHESLLARMSLEKEKFSSMISDENGIIKS